MTKVIVSITGDPCVTRHVNVLRRMDGVLLRMGVSMVFAGGAPKFRQLDLDGSELFFDCGILSDAAETLASVRFLLNQIKPALMSVPAVCRKDVLEQVADLVKKESPETKLLVNAGDAPSAGGVLLDGFVGNAAAVKRFDREKNPDKMVILAAPYVSLDGEVAEGCMTLAQAVAAGVDYVVLDENHVKPFDMVADVKKVVATAAAL